MALRNQSDPKDHRCDGAWGLIVQTINYSGIAIAMKYEVTSLQTAESGGLVKVEK